MEPEKRENPSASEWDRVQIKKSAKFWLPACLALTAILLIFAILLTYILATDAQRNRDLRTIAEQKKIEESQKTENQLDNLALLESILQDRSLYGTELETEDFLQAAFELYKEKSGDRYAEYYTEETYRLLYKQLAGQAVGIGVSADRETVLYEEREIPALRVKTVLAGSAAEQSGLVAGEWIIAVQNAEGELKSIAELGGYEKAILTIQGEEGTEVTLQILSETDGVFSIREVVCTRQPILSESVFGTVLESDPSIAVIRIREFSFNTPVQFCRAIEDCRAAGAQKFVLDIRDHSGGSMISLISVLSYFVPNGEVLYSEKRADGSITPILCTPRTYTGEKDGCTVTEEQIGQYRNAGLSFVVLCNEKTASAAELFAVVLKESGAAEAVFGQRTTGKWVAQSFIEIPFQTFKAYVRFTVYQCLSPEGNSYQDEGYLPDHEVTLAPEYQGIETSALQWEQDLQLQAAVAFLQTPAT